MRNLLAFLAAAVLVFLGVGWYLDWYSFKSLPTGSAGHQSFNIDINKSKITSDVQKGEEKIQEVIDKKKAEATTPNPAAQTAAATNEVKHAVKTAARRIVNTVEEAPHSTGLNTGGPGGSGPIK